MLSQILAARRKSFTAEFALIGDRRKGGSGDTSDNMACITLKKCIPALQEQKKFVGVLKDYPQESKDF